ncbi:MAG: energy transducer TonB [Burkholderiaceae bacterium]|nr:energy transducer TonB [Burkholderiaceae bacterium]
MNTLTTSRDASLPVEPLEPDATSTRFLRWAILLSLLCHAALLGWQRQVVVPVRPPVSELEIVMMNAGTDSAPVKAQVLAQVNVDGGGQATSGVASNSLPYLDQAPEAVVLERLIKQRLQLEAEQQQLLTQLQSQQLVQDSRPAEQFLKDSQEPGQDERNQEQVLLNSALTALSEQVQQYNQRPRKMFDAPSAQQARFAEYVNLWRQRIEEIGTQQYPAGTEGKAYGSVQASLTIRSDGVLIDISIDRPSDKALLNQAVTRIAQLASPFAPFPREMALHVDQIVLTRTWHFVDGTLQARSP